MSNYIKLSLIMLLCSDISLSQTKSAQGHNDFHLIYIDISRSMDRQGLSSMFVKLLDQLTEKNDDYFVYLSNGYKPEILYCESDKKNSRLQFVSFLQTLNTSPPMLMFDKDSILKFWDKYDITSVSPEGKTVLKYKNIYFHYFVSFSLFNLDEEELIDRLLLVKDLTRKHVDVKRIFIELLYEKNDSEGFTDRREQLKVNNSKGYNYLFTSY